MERIKKTGHRRHRAQGRLLAACPEHSGGAPLCLCKRDAGAPTFMYASGQEIAHISLETSYRLST